MKTTQDWIDSLQLLPHPEGGFYRETYRSPLPVEFPNFSGARAVSTAIFFLLPAGNVSAFHRIKSDEIWHFYAGQPLTIHLIATDGRLAALTVGPDLPQAVVPAGCWFGATVEQGYALVGCTVAPGFDFCDFEMAERSALLGMYPQHRTIIERLTKPARSD